MRHRWMVTRREQAVQHRWAWCGSKGAQRVWAGTFANKQWMERQLYDIGAFMSPEEGKT
jgi:hypothetical protein